MISIIIPSYNQQEYLPDAIESALNQTEVAEIIVIDDGSTDNSLEIAKRYIGVRRKNLKEEPRHWMMPSLTTFAAEGNPIIVISQVNKGLASARNTGIMNAKGDWILPLDADDILQENCIEKILEAIEKNPEADIIAPSFKTFGTSNEQVILMDNPKLENFKTGNRIGYCAAIRKSALLEVGGYNPKMIKGFEDYDLWFDLLKRGKIIVTIPEVLWLYRTKPKSMYTEAKKSEYELLSQIRFNHPDIKWPSLLKPENVI